MTITDDTSARMQSEASLRSHPAPEPALYEAALLVSLLEADPCIPDRNTDWKALEEMARANGVLALAFNALLNAGAEVPDAFVQSAKASKASAAHHAMELRDLLITFAQQKIDVLPLKGPPLSLAFYGDVSLRPSRDLDLLVRSKDFARAEEILMGRGFLPWGPCGRYHRQFLRDDLMVELHFQLSSRRSLPFHVEDVWRRAVNVEFLGAPARAMSKDDLVLFLCWHGLKHRYTRLVWILDVARALQGWRTEEYKSLLGHTRRHDLEPWLLTGCEAVRFMFPRQVPEPLDAVIALSPMLKRARRAATGIFSGDLTREITDYRCFYLQTGQNRLKRWRYRASIILNFFELQRVGSGQISPHVKYRFAADLRGFRALRKYGVRRACRMLFPPRGQDGSH